MDWEKEKLRLDLLPFALPSKLTDILDGFKKAIHEKKMSIVILVDGKSGKGKTTLGGQVCSYVDPNFNLSKIHYNPYDFLSSKEKIGIAQSQEGDALLFDEALMISNRSALSAVNRAVVQAMSMMRSRKICVVFCANSIFDLDKNLAIFRSDLLLHVYGNGLTDRGKFLAFFKGADDIDRIKELYLYGKKTYSYSMPKCNFNSTFPGYFVVDEKEYDTQKNQGVASFLENPSGKLKEARENRRETKAIEARRRCISWIIENTTLTQQEIANISGVSVRTIEEDMAWARKTLGN